MRKFLAVPFPTDLSLEEMAGRLASGPWKWSPRESEHDGEYLSSGPARIVPTARGARLELFLDTPHPRAEQEWRAMTEIVEREILPRIRVAVPASEIDAVLSRLIALPSLQPAAVARAMGRRARRIAGHEYEFVGLWSALGEARLRRGALAIVAPFGVPTVPIEELAVWNERPFHPFAEGLACLVPVGHLVLFPTDDGLLEGILLR